MATRTYPVPANARTHGLGSEADLDDLDEAARRGNTWAGRVVGKENQRWLTNVLGDNPVLPKGMVTEDDIVHGLVRDGQVFHTEWEPLAAGAMPRVIDLDPDEVAFIARAFSEDAKAVVLRPTFPIASLTAAAGATVTVPDAGRVLAVVDELDRNAVMDLVVVLPGPKIQRRHDGEWRDDPKWLSILRSVKPPPIIELTDAAQIGQVASAVDEATAGAPFDRTAKEEPEAQTAAGARADEMVIEFALLASRKSAQRLMVSEGMVAAPKKGNIGKSASERGKAAARRAKGGSGMPPKLRRYWQTGAGAAKIRWGTPGAMTRCARYLKKYVGPHRSYQTCNNLSKALGGRGVAWDVG